MNVKCENCLELHSGEYGSGRFCSNKCSRSYATKGKRLEINQKVSTKLKIKNSSVQKPFPICESCPNFCKKRTARYCSHQCKNSSKNMREIHSKIMLDKVADGTHSGWSVKTKSNPSYAESYFEELFNKEGFDYTRELRVGRFCIDFAFDDFKLAVEIDGKQHKIPERKERDDRKDEYLKSKGWTVFRIEWKVPRCKEDEDHLKSKVDEVRNLLQ